MKKTTFSLLLCTVLQIVVSYGVAAQTGTSSVSGTVTDPQGNLVPNATVTLTSVGTSTSRTQQTNDSGVFNFELIPPGEYQLEVQVSGFKKAVVPDVRALVSRANTVDVTLEIGNVAESVTISATGSEALINTRDATIGNNFVSQQIIQLPLESRNVVELLSLQPGVTPGGYVTGSRADQANVTLDGVDVNEQQSGLDIVADLAFNEQQAFASVLRSTPDSVQEFRVTTTNPNATQGRSSGGQVSLITKSGTNEFHGSLYEVHRNTVTSANDFFNNRSGVPRATLLRNVFGGSFGGPIKKDRAYFFYTYEGRRDASQASVVRTVPLPSLGRGEVRYNNVSGGITTLTAADINNLFPDVGVNPVGLAVLADAASRYRANDTTTGDGLNTGGFRFNAPTPLRWNTHIARLDFNLTEDGRHLLFLRGNYQQDVIGGVPQFPDTPAPNLWNHPTGLAIGHTWTISSSLVNNFRYGYTREAFTNQGDSTENFITFRFVFEPRRFLRTLSRTTPVQNFTDDLSWVKGTHNLQFGTNVRLIRNDRTTFANSFDEAIANPSFYNISGAVLSDPIISAFSGTPDEVSGSDSPIKNAVSAVIGRFSQYAGNFNFDIDGNVLGIGEGIRREFATEEYDFYAQDTWKFRPNLTFTLGMRYGLSRPVYETGGLQVKPTVSLGTFFEQRKAGAAAGVPFNELITFDLAGPKNNRPGFYEMDTNNFQPRVAVAWSPEFRSGFLGKIFGSGGTSVLRGGFAITNDYFGQQLAVQFDSLNALGFSSNQTIAANTFDVVPNADGLLPPAFTGFNQNVRSLPLINVPSNLTFPLTFPADEAQRIEFALDDTLVSPTSYSWNVSFGRTLPKGMFFEASYIGRLGRDLLAQRDIMALNNLVDPQSGMDWNTAAGLLHDIRGRNTHINDVQPIAYFENLWPGLGANFWGEPSLSATQSVYAIVAREDFVGFDFFNVLDWTFVQLLIDDLSAVGPNAFFHPQVAALAAFSTFAKSDYHAGTLSFRQRYKEQFSFDLNYTLSKSMDNASGLQSSLAYDTAFVLNSLRPNDNRSVSDFDIRHIINGNAIWQLPIGRGKTFLSGASGPVNAILGGWQLSGIFRWNSGLPAPNIFDAAQWATNWNVQSFGVRTRPIQSTPTRGGTGDPNLFSDPLAAYRSFRNAKPGETGDRNVLRQPGFVTVDLGLSKSFTMPWSEEHKLQFRWEVFNVSNTQRLRVTPDGITRESFGLAIDPDLTEPAPTFGNFNAIQGTPRVMQFGLRYVF
ncbi:MAG TPA: TonB-dependent receptor [Pyrinomonadaceae bacterium]|nr:TonB-dependent receptor [Pyrinomonadaceae bacterium]